jgi:hypothetical protein
MTPSGLLVRLRARGVDLWREGETIRYRGPEGAVTPELRDALAQHKADLIDLVIAGAPNRSGENAPGRQRYVRSSALAAADAGSTCWWCRGTQFWESRFGVIVCASCHPPSCEAFVARWVGVDEERHHVLRVTAPGATTPSAQDDNHAPF